MDMGGQITMSAPGGISIPMDVVADILCRLTMKSVLRFKAISKAWCSLIDSSYFARLQLSASMETNDDLMLVILPYKDTDKTGYVVCANFYSLDDDNDDVDGDGASSLSQVRPRSCPFKPRKGCTLPLGSCHGMLVLGSEDGNLDFWNPTNNQCYSTSLAPDQTRALNRTGSRFVFYHDTCSNQYKLVQKVSNGGICEFQTYNLEANGFTTFHTLPDDHAVDYVYIMPLEKLSPIDIPGAPHSFQAILCPPSLVNYQS
ncbi:hypothetical protein Tsubulata_047621 [Turnera subulata]|uniref:F-box domain-containing protein n=1 Tax=Turnera subulata TaxID=218843 RepID=A0A9Q0G6D9_9ROSI|nr:hypothetical protein Tsubulata_047621 [Turnera subulata]